eukprot:g10457.t1
MYCSTFLIVGAVILSQQLAYCKKARQPRIADEQITWFYANSLEDGAAFLQLFGTEIKGLKQEDECRIFQTAKEHFCGVCNTRPAPTCPAGPEGPSAESVTYTLVVKNTSRVDEYYRWFQSNDNAVTSTRPSRSSKFAVYAFNFYDRNRNTGLGCYRFEVQTFLDPKWPPSQAFNVPTVKFATSFGDHMVLQREPYVAKIWGFVTNAKYSSSEFVIVNLFTTSGYSKKTPLVTLNASVDSSSGEWVATLPYPIKGSCIETYVVTAEMAPSVARIEDVLFGDVFLASGQSNMAFLLKNAFNGSQLVQDANNYPSIRLFTSKKIASKTELDEQPEVEEPWSVGSNLSVVMHNVARMDDDWLYMSAVAWLFARRVYQKIEIPIGILNTNWGGTPIEFWMSKEALDACPDPHGTKDSQSPHQGWNGMIAPLLRTNIRGVIWYQGENNADQKDGAELYKCRFPAMIADWREKFSSFEHFGFVQLSSYLSDADVPGIRWSQTAGYGYVPNEKMPNTFMSLAIDLGDKDSPYGSVHSRHKMKVGTRLGDQALEVIYGFKNTNTRPILHHTEAYKNGFLLSFTNTDLVVVRNASVGWEICNNVGSDCVPGYVTSFNSTSVLLKGEEAVSVVSGNTIRYLWSSYACELLSCSLYGPGTTSDALPVAPFKTIV